ncbi:MAG: threonine/serine exporter family protein, partial [Clostridia bacterium]|nr:threonine/serine exporter family protein [Clostridia bacterium]
MTQFEWIQIITGFIGSVGFAILFNERGKKMIGAILGGLFSWLLFVLLKFVSESEPLRYFIVAFAISLYSELMARRLKTPSSTFLMTALIPLIPGGSLYYTMAAVFEGNVQNFATKAVG